MPSKALLRPAELLAEVERVPGAREAVSGKLDVAAVLARRDEVIHDLDDSIQEPWLEQRHVTVVRGRGRLDGERRVRVGERTLEARTAVIVATGSGAAVPPIPGLRETGPRRRAAGRGRAAAPDRRSRTGDGRARARADDRGRQRNARARLRLAIRDRRRERPRPLETYGL